MCHKLLKFFIRVIDITQERHGWADCIYLELKKAFDKPFDRKLLWKLEHVKSGVPQLSVLAPKHL